MRLNINKKEMRRTEVIVGILAVFAGIGIITATFNILAWVLG